MIYMNDSDFYYARTAVTGKPNYTRVLDAVERLADWTDTVSDGWTYWIKPRRAATKAMEALTSATKNLWSGADFADLTDAEAKKLLTPIKAFLTREGYKFSEVIGE